MSALSVLIPNYNGAGLLEENLPYTLKALENLPLTWEIVVADDASSDASCRFLQDNYPEILLVKGEKNLGFAGNCNRGVRACKGSWILLLNSDVKLSSDYLKNLLPHTSDSSVFGLSGSIFPDGPGSIMDAGKYPGWKGTMLNTTLNFLPAPGSGTVFPSLFLSGAASLLHAEKFREIGGFQELLNPYYFEDAEIALNAWRRGWSSLFVPEAKCYHRISSTIAGTARKSAIRTVARRNKFLLHEIHLGGTRKIIWKISLLFYFLWVWFLPQSVKAQAFKEYLKRKKEADRIRGEINAIPGIRSLEQVVAKLQRALQGKIDSRF
jgi:GT2 family glycosyltransferase